MFEFFIAILALGLALGCLAAALNSVRAVYTVWSFQEGLLFRHGEYLRILAPGRHVVWGRGFELQLVDKHLRQLTVQSQEITTQDKAAIRVSAIAHYRVVDGLKFLTEAQAPEQVLYASVQLALREVVGGLPVDSVLEDRSSFAGQLKLLVLDTAEKLGLEIESVDIRDVLLGGDLKKAYSGVLRAKKEALAGLEKARGEAAALRTLSNGARQFEKNPHLLQLRYLQLLEDAGQSGVIARSSWAQPWKTS